MTAETMEQRMRAHLQKHPHDTMTETAAALGVSRQRIHAAAARYGITFNAKARPVALARFQCPGCGLEAWTKPGAALICGRCRVAMG